MYAHVYLGVAFGAATLHTLTSLFLRGLASLICAPRPQSLRRLGKTIGRRVCFVSVLTIGT